MGGIVMMVTVVAVLAIAGMACYVIYWKISNLLAPITRIEAFVVRKRAKPWDFSIQFDSLGMMAARFASLGRDRRAAAKALLNSAKVNDGPELGVGGCDYYVTFDAKGKELEFGVPKATYMACEENLTGLLVYQGEQFKQFIPAEKLPDIRLAEDAN